MNTQSKIEKNSAGYLVTDYPNADGSPRYTQYKNTDDLSKILPIVSKVLNGLPVNSDRVIIYYNDDGSVNKVDCEVFSTKKDESLQVNVKASDQIDASTQQDIVDLKAQLDIKPAQVDQPIK